MTLSTVNSGIPGNKPVNFGVAGLAGVAGVAGVTPALCCIDLVSVQPAPGWSEPIHAR